jgi:hypothetical protein
LQFQLDGFWIYLGAASVSNSFLIKHQNLYQTFDMLGFEMFAVRCHTQHKENRTPHINEIPTLSINDSPENSAGAESYFGELLCFQM